MTFLIAMAWATPAQTLEALASEYSSSETYAGTLHYAGHGAAPGAKRELPFSARIDRKDHAYSSIWQGDGWIQRTWHNARSTLEGDPWSLADEPDKEALVALAPRPELLLRWLARRPEQLRQVGDDVLWGFSRGLATLHIENGSLKELEWREAHPVFGDVKNGISWSDGAVEITMTEADTRWTATLTPSPAGPTLPKEPSGVRVRSEPLHEGSWLLEVPEADSRVVLMTHGNEGVLLDAPLSSELGELLWKEAAALAPDVTTWTVVVSHHHPHYTGGLRPWVRNGASILVHSDLATWLRSELGTNRHGDPAVDPVLLLVRPGDTQHVLDGQLWVRAIDAASGHTDAFLVSFMHTTRTLYVADLARQPENGAARHRGTWPALVERWNVESVISGFPLTNAATFPFASITRARR